jgi:uncharacterized protein (DUF2141 family)
MNKSSISNTALRCLLVAALLSNAAAVLAQESGSVRLEVAGLQGASGNIHIAVYDSEDKWLGDDVVLSQKVVIAEALKGDLVLSELKLPVGDYAFSVFYDANNNGKLDTNFIGIPKEPVALSNNARPKFGPPKYKDAVFAVGAEPVTQRIDIEAI